MTDDGASETNVEVIGEPLDADDRVALQTLLDFLKPMVHQLAEQTGATGRWLLASLLAVNGGSIIAALNVDDIGGRTELTAMGFWLAGLLFALASGFLSMTSGQRGLATVSRMYSTVVVGLHSGRFPDLRFDAEQADMERRGKTIVRVGLLSAVAFSIGAFVVAGSLT